MRLAVTSECNFSCVYCKAGGEGIATSEILSLDEMVTMLKIASDVGFRHVKVTGGEPLLRQKIRGDIIPLIQKIIEEKYFDSTTLVTNGSLLSEYAKSLAEAGLYELTVSLDAAEQKKFREINRIDAFEKVLEGIHTAKSNGLHVTINSVIYRSNKDQIEGLVEIAQKFKTRLKLLDYMDVDAEASWSENYVPFKEIREYLRARSKDQIIILPPGGLGTPMEMFTLEDGTEVIIKDSTIGTNYNNLCTSCTNYPCQDALISLRITANGALKRCLIRDDNLQETLIHLRKGNLNELKHQFEESYAMLENSTYKANAWRPLHNEFTSN